MADRVFTSAQSSDTLQQLNRATGLEYATLARLALAYSLKEHGSTVPESIDVGGREIRWISVFGSSEQLLKCLIATVHERDLPDEVLFGKAPCIGKSHIDDGCDLLGILFQKCNHDPTAFYAALVETLPAGSAEETPNIDIFLGLDVRSNEEVVASLNDTGRHTNSHLAIVGKTGTGKTQCLLKILADIREQSSFQTHYIVFDYKGDIADNARFVEVTRPLIYRPPSDRLPINPFQLSNPTDDEQRLTAREMAESFASIDSKLGPVQRGALMHGIQASYARRSNDRQPYPDFVDLFDVVRSAYSEEGKKDDTLIEILRDLAEFKLFWDHSVSTPPLSSMFEQSVIVDLHRLPVLKELVAYLIIERLYKEMTELPDSEIADGRRRLRTVLVIDEAHNYLPHRNSFLQKTVREGRSKGVAVFFASQSPSDYAQRDFDFKELLEFFLMFQCDGLSAGDLQDLIGCDQNTARRLQTEVPRLKPFEVVSKPMETDRPYVRFRAQPFFEAY